MFNIPVTLLYRTDERIIPLPASVAIENIISINHIDSEADTGVESYSHPDLVPRCVIRHFDGELVVSDPYHQLLVYLDAYKAFDPDFADDEEDDSIPAPPDRSGSHLTLIHGSKCATSQVSTPD